MARPVALSLGPSPAGSARAKLASAILAGWLWGLRLGQTRARPWRLGVAPRPNSRATATAGLACWAAGCPSARATHVAHSMAGFAASLLWQRQAGSARRRDAPRCPAAPDRLAPRAALGLIQCSPAVRLLLGHCFRVSRSQPGERGRGVAFGGRYGHLLCLCPVTHNRWRSQGALSFLFNGLVRYIPRCSRAYFCCVPTN